MLDPQTLDTLKKLTLTHINPTQHKVFVFGSHVRGNNRRWSDIDLGIDGDNNPLHPEVIINLQDAFENSDLPYKVDIVNFAHVTPDFRASALKHALYLN
ncbi:MAG: nucleotidyltransferase domain-containing protein [bacterium]|nr:nucleotidyltransferase domain-containing protein [Candidatus Microgenomates bacterium CPR3]MCQ3944975.1 nucleotidyltransferase domain-containing protein [bacterium]